MRENSNRKMSNKLESFFADPDSEDDDIDVGEGVEVEEYYEEFFVSDAEEQVEDTGRQVRALTCIPYPLHSFSHVLTGTFTSTCRLVMICLIVHCSIHLFIPSASFMQDAADIEDPSDDDGDEDGDSSDDDDGEEGMTTADGDQVAESKNEVYSCYVFCTCN